MSSSPTLTRLATNTALLKTLQMTTIASLSIVSGIATSLYLWVIPIVLRARSTRTKISQFNHTIALGFKYLQTSSRILSACRASLAILFYNHPNPTLASRWKYYALAIGALITTAPYEIYAIFPTNDRVAKMGKELGKEKQDDFGDHRDKEVVDLLRKWQWRHVGRIASTIGALTVCLWSVVAEQAF